jgi:transposase
MQQGLSNEDACRIVGVNPKTGRRWRNGRRPSGRNKAAPPVRPVVPPSSSSRFLREDERIYIADRLREKATVRAIAAELGRSPSTISREIRRNRTVGTRGQWHYRPYAAQARADGRRPRPKPRKVHQNPELWDFVQAGLDRRWSPEQILETASPAAGPFPYLYLVFRASSSAYSGHQSPALGPPLQSPSDSPGRLTHR